MDRSELRLIKAYFAAQMIHHYYWVHTDGDEPDGKISIENVQRIVARITGLAITKFLVDFEAEVTQGNVERKHGAAIIHVREKQSEEEQRFTAIKELFHLIADDEGDFSVDVVKTLGDLVKYQERALDGLASDGLRSERNAEIMALEIIYPFEYRDVDFKAHNEKNEPLESISKRRGVPLYWVRRALSKSHLDSSRRIWKTLPVDIQFPPLPEVGEVKSHRIVIVEEEAGEGETDEEENGGK